MFIRPTGEDRLLLEVLYYADEVRSDDEIAVGDVALSDTEVHVGQTSHRRARNRPLES